MRGAWRSISLSLSAHKMYGPEGRWRAVRRKASASDRHRAALPRRRPRARFAIGHVERAAIIGFGQAAEICVAERDAEARRLASLRDARWQGIRSVGEVYVNGSMEHRLPQNLNVRFDALPGN